MTPQVKTVLFWLLIVVAAMLLWQVVRSERQVQAMPEISYSQFISAVEAGNVASVFITGTEIHGWYRNGKGSLRLTGPSNPAVYLDVLRKEGVEIRFGNAPQSTTSQLMGTWAPLILLGGLWFFMIRQMQKARRQAPPAGPGASPIEPK